MFPLQKSFLKKNFQKNRAGDPEAGGTLLEILLAIIVMAVVAASFGPILVLAVAGRVQNLRAQQALQRAQGEIDRVRLIVQQGLAADVPRLPPSVGANESLAAIAPPTGGQDTGNCDANGVASNANSWCPLDLDRDGTPEMAIQTFRSTDANPLNAGEANPPRAFVMGVRIYMTEALFGTLPLDRCPASLGINSGALPRGPVIALYAPIVESESTDSALIYNELATRIENANNSCN